MYTLTIGIVQWILPSFYFSKGAHMTGIIRRDRGPPQFLKDEVLEKKISSFARKGPVLICKYEDRKTIFSITTK